jgi:hypothetical protein
VEQVLGDVPKDQRCKCAEERPPVSSAAKPLWKLW